MSLSDDLKKDLQTRRDDLRQIADEIRVKLHLAGMDAKDRWNDVEPKLRDFEKRVERAGEKAGHELGEMAKDLKARMQRIRDDLRSS